MSARQGADCGVRNGGSRELDAGFQPEMPVSGGGLLCKTGALSILLFRHAHAQVSEEHVAKLELRTAPKEDVILVSAVHLALV